MINVTLSLMVKIESHSLKTPLFSSQNKFFQFMRTESQQTNTSNFPYKNKRKKAHALHHTRYQSNLKTNKNKQQENSKH